MLALVMMSMPRSVSAFFQEIGGSRIELALHDGRHQVDDGDIHTLALQAVGCLKAEQAGADDDGPPLAFRDPQHGVDVVEIAVGQHAGQLMTRYRDDEGQRARGDNKLVVGDGDAVRRGDRLRMPVNLCDLGALVEGHAVRRVPVVIVDDDVFICLFA